jgi:hypothetical protein
MKIEVQNNRIYSDTDMNGRVSNFGKETNQISFDESIVFCGTL